MPNHIHGIIEIDEPQQQETKIKSLSNLMGAYKTTSSKRIHLAEMDRSALDKEGITLDMDGSALQRDRSALDKDRSRPVLTGRF